jgi:hypothetical protein
VETIAFKRQTQGFWRRDDGKTKKHVNEADMRREIQVLYAEGWEIETHGISFIRMIIATRDSS